jgi:creatinine amidohydrolase
MNVVQYIDITSRELAALDRDRTVIFSSASPVETHGEHLPLGTDLFIAESVRDRMIERFGRTRPDWTALVLPTLCLGANAIPVPGSIPIGHRAILRAVLDTGQTLAELGFRTWVLTDNHGGPLHQIAIEVAARKLARRDLCLVAPFHALFRRMVDRDPELLQQTGLPPAQCGASDDSHAGTNETSLMLALCPEKVRGSWESIGPARRSPDTLPLRLLSGAGRLLDSAGMHTAAVDLRFLSEALAWVGDPCMASYQGDPSLASREAGEAMFRYHVDLGMNLLEQAVAGRCPRPTPIGWSLRVLRFLL